MTDKKQVDHLNDHLKAKTNSVNTVGFDSTREKYGWLEVEHGLTGDGDYIWIFSDYHPQRRIPDNQQKTIEIIVTYLDKVLPDEVEKECQPSPENWERKVIFVKAIGVGDKWNFEEEDMKKNLPKIGELVSEEIEKHTVRRKFL